MHKISTTFHQQVGGLYHMLYCLLQYILSIIHYKLLTIILYINCQYLLIIHIITLFNSESYVNVVSPAAFPTRRNTQSENVSEAAILFHCIHHIQFTHPFVNKKGWSQRLGWNWDWRWMKRKSAFRVGSTGGRRANGPLQRSEVFSFILHSCF